jgi:hypothetical protein
MPEAGLGSSSTIEKHIDQMETLAAAFVIPSVVVLLAAAAIPKEFEIFDIHLATADGYGIVVASFDVLLILFCTACWKACDLLEACDETESPKAITAILTHKWVMNPFSYTSAGVLSALCCAVGPGLLVFAWWIALSGLTLLSSVSISTGVFERCLFMLYCGLGFLATVTVVRFDLRIVTTSNKITKDPNAGTKVPSLTVSNLAKVLFALFASGVGFWMLRAFRHVA